MGMVNAQDFIRSKKGDDIKVAVGRGGQTVNLTRAQFNEALQLARSGQKSFFGRKRNVKKFAGFILAEQGRRGATIQKDILIRGIQQRAGQSLPDLRGRSLGELGIEAGQFSKGELVRLIERDRKQNLPGIRELSKKEIIDIAIGRRGIDSRLKVARRRQPITQRVGRRIISSPDLRRVEVARLQRQRIRSVASSIILSGGKINRAISSRLKRIGLTDKNIEKISEKIVRAPFTEKSVEELLTSESIKARKLGKVGKAVRETQKSVVKGFAKEARDKPVTAVLTFGAGRVIPPLLQFTRGTRVLKRISKATPKALKRAAGKTIPKVLLASYLAGSGLEIAATPRGRRVEKVGGKVSTEVIPFIIGTNRGVRGVLRKELKVEIDDVIKTLPETKRNVFNDLMKKANLLTNVKTTVRDVDLARLKRIPDAAKKPIIKFLKDEDIIIGGSLGQQTAVKVKRSLAQSDLDLYTEKDHVKAAAQLRSRLRKLGIKRIGGKKGQVTIAGAKAAEFHDITRLNANIESVIPSWRSPRSFIVRTKSGIRVPKITVQLKRKLVGGFTDPKREKDLKDARDILNQLFKRAEIKARGKFLFREKNIKALEKAFKVKISRKPLTVEKPKLIIRKKPITTKIKKAKLPIRLPSTRKVGGVRRGIVSKKIDRVKPSRLAIKKKASQASIKRKLSQLAIKRRASQSLIRRRQSQRATKKPRRLTVPSQPPRRRIIRRPPSKLPTRGTPSQPARRPPRKLSPPKGPPTKIPKKLPTRGIPPVIRSGTKGRIKKRRPKETGFNVFGKTKGKFMKLNRLPLRKQDALSRGAWAIDNSTARTLKIKPAGQTKRFGTIALKEKGYFNKKRIKIRGHRIVKGRKKKLKNTFIEKRRFGIDTRGEKKQLSLAKLVKREGFLKRKRPAKTVKRSPRALPPRQKETTSRRNIKTRTRRINR